MAEASIGNRGVFNPPTLPHTRREFVDENYRSQKKPRKVVLFCNGDRFFKGRKVNVTPHRYLSFNDLLNDITNKLPRGVQLPYGVRQIYTPRGGKKIRDINELQEGQSYVCAGFEIFKQIKYGVEELEPWSTGRSQRNELPSSYSPTGPTDNSSYRYGAFRPSHPLRQSYPRPRQLGGLGTNVRGKPGYTIPWGASGAVDHNKPKIITVVRNNPKPRNKIKMFLNRKSVQTFEQILKDMSDAFAPTDKGYKVRKLFSIRGREIQGFNEFFRDDDVFIGVGAETLTIGDVEDIIHDIYPDSPYASSLTKEWERSRRKNILGKHKTKVKEDKGKSQNNKAPGKEKLEGTARDDKYKGRLKEPHDKADTTKDKVHEEKESGSKIDSGLGSEDYKDDPEKESNSKLAVPRPIPTEGTKPKKSKTRKHHRYIVEDNNNDPRKQSKYSENVDNPVKSSRQADDGSEMQKSSQRTAKDSDLNELSHRAGDDSNLVLRLERDRRREAEYEINSERRRRYKKLETARRIQNDLVRRHGQIPQVIENPFKKMDDERAKERERLRRDSLARARRDSEELARLRHRKKAMVPEGDTDAAATSTVRETNRVHKIIPTKVDELPRITNRDGDGDEKQSVQSERGNDNIVKPVTDDSKKQEEDEKVDDKEEVVHSSSHVQTNEDNKDTEKKEGKERSHTEISDKEIKVQEVQKIAEDKKESNLEKRGNEPNVKADTPDIKAEVPVTEQKEKSHIAEDTHQNGDKENEQKETIMERKRKSKSKSVVRKTKLERQISNADYISQRYEELKLLGDGNFAVVNQCRKRDTGAEFAIKIIEKSKLKGKEHMIENEIEIMKSCKHPNIVRLYEEFETKTQIFLLMELVKGGDLFDAITQSVKFKESEAAGMVSDLATALFYLHSRGILHRDLKPENLLVHRNRDNSITLKLADFGLAMEVDEPIFTVCGTPTYVAPEILSEIGYGLEVDMWAVGVINYILLCGFPPFRSPDRNQSELFECIKAGVYEFLSPYWDGVSRAAKDLIKRLLIVDKSQRYKAADVLCHPWIITLGGVSRPTQPLDEYRKNLRRELDFQAKQQKDLYNLSKARLNQTQS